MQPLRRTGLRSARNIRPQLQRQCRRQASDSHGSHAPDSHAAPQNESFGRGFFVALAAIPASVAIIQYARSGDRPYFTRLISDTYDSYKDKWAQRNDLHVQMLEQAAADRVLFLNESQRPLPTLRFPEQLNTGSPWNVPAGHGRVNIDRAIEKYEKEAFEAQEKKLQQMRENKIPVEQPSESLIRRAPGPSN